MTVRTRLVVVGAVLPTALLVIAIAIAGLVFGRAQRADLDRHLLAQAAVESVGLFDGPDGGPHVHVPRSPIAAAVKDFAARGAIYDARGARVVDVAEPAWFPDTVAPPGEPGAPRLSDRTIQGVPHRVLELAVDAPDHRRYTLWLGVSRAGLDATLARFWTIALAVAGAVALVLLALQLAVARRLVRRIDALTAFAPRLHDGDAALAADPARDELAALNAAMRDVAHRLAEARAEQDRLLASAAHELRTPLTVLRTEVDLALRKQRSADELREALRAVRADVERLGALAAALLDLQAIRHVDFARRDGDVVELVREAIAGLRVVAEARQVAIALVGAPAAPARFDERALRQAVDNLLGNALKHAPAGTAVTVEVAATPAGGATLAVTDRGPGVPADDAERIFEPFARGPGQPTTGAGLGLAIVREVATRHGGRAWLDQNHAGGARFVIAIG